MRNNPLTLIDPSGFGWLSERWQDIKEGGWKYIAAVVNPQLALAAYTTDKGLRKFGRFARKNRFVAELTQIAGCFAAPGVGCVAVSAGVSYGVTDGDIGAAAKAGAIAYIQMGVAHEIGLKFDTGTFTDGAMAVGAHGLLGGGISLAQGGKFGYGFAAGAFGKAVTVGLEGTPLYTRAGGAFTNKSWEAVAIRTAIAAAAGGTASELSGGSFANGAVTGAMQHLFNAEGLPQGMVDVFTGFGDGVYSVITLGVGDLSEVRGWLSIDGGIDYDSALYEGAETAGKLHGAFVAGGVVKSLNSKYNWVTKEAPHKGMGPHLHYGPKYPNSQHPKYHFGPKNPLRGKQNFDWKSWWKNGKPWRWK